MKSLSRSCLMLACLSWSSAASAQDLGFEITPHVGYQFGGSSEVQSDPDDPDSVPGELDLASTPSFGITLGRRVRAGAYGEFTYSRQHTNLGLASLGNPRQELFDMSVEYLLLGGLLDFRRSEFSRVAPFFALQLGAARFDPEDESGLGDEWRFAVSLAAGVKIDVLPQRLGLRLQGRMLTTFMSSQSAVFCPGNGKCLFLVDDVSALFQGEGSLGVWIAF